MTPNRISAVAVPRRQPRRARRLTPGSMASDRNTEIASRTKSPLSLPQKKRTARAARKPPQKTTTAGTTQRGSAPVVDASRRPSSLDAWPRRPATALDGVQLAAVGLGGHVRSVSTGRRSVRQRCRHRRARRRRPGAGPRQLAAVRRRPRRRAPSQPAISAQLLGQLAGATSLDRTPELGEGALHAQHAGGPVGLEVDAADELGRRAGTAARSSRRSASAAACRSRCGSGSRTAARCGRGSRPASRTG